MSHDTIGRILTLALAFGCSAPEETGARPPVVEESVVEESVVEESVVEEPVVEETEGANLDDSVEDTSGAMSDETTRTRLFLYELSLTPPEECQASGEPQPMRVRGYQLAFSGRAGENGASTATLQPIRGDGTVPGVTHQVDSACLESLDASFGARGYERATIHVEAIEPGRGGPTVEATAYVLSDSASSGAAGAPNATYIARLRAGWENAGLDTDALDHAAANP